MLFQGDNKEIPKGSVVEVTRLLPGSRAHYRRPKRMDLPEAWCDQAHLATSRGGGMAHFVVQP